MLAQLSLWIGLALRVPGLPASPPAVDSHAHCLPADSTLPASPRAIPLAFPIFPPCLSGVINDYAPVIGFGCDSSSLQMGTLNGFAPGDKVLLLQMQVSQVDLSNTASFGTLLNTSCIGNYEFNRIQSLGGNTIQLQYALTRPYDVSGKVQLVRVPEYDSATVCNLSCLPWNGTVGGVLALDVKNQLTLSGNVDVSGKGFRGGVVDNTIIPWIFGEMQYFYPPVSTLAAAKGEGVVIIPTDHSFGRGRAGNGGGGGNAHNAGGGGGGNAGAGGGGGYEILNLPGTPTPLTNGVGGQKYFDNQFNKLLLGGGAGAGHANDGLGTSGGSGGGMVFVLANSLKTNNFKILANGVDVFGGVDYKDGQGGGGGGGSVVLKINQIIGSLGCELKGGRGGSNPYTPDFQLHGPGGGGGGGKLLLTQISPNVVPVLQGGINGLTSQNFSNGAFQGEAGKMLTGFTLPEDAQPAHPVSDHLLLAAQSPLCAGTSTGRIAVLQSSALSFNINGGPWQPDSVFAGLTPGTYTIGLRFSGGCTLDTVAVLTTPPPLRDSLLSIVPATCLLGGSIRVQAVSGTAPFAYQLDNGAWQSSGLFSGLLPGNYSITLRDAGGCTQSHTYTVQAPPPSLDSLVAITDATCLAGGSVQVMAVSGTAPFTYQLDNGAWQAEGLFSNLPPGNYQVTMLDAAGCTHSTSYQIMAPPPAQDSVVTIIDATCTIGGSVHVVALSGTAPFEYQLDNGAWQATGIFSDLATGNYTVTLRDAAGCTHSQVYEIAAPPPLLDSLLLTVRATCIHGGALSISAVSGTAPFEFQLDNGLWQSSGTFTDLAAGSYAVSLRDAAGCTHSQTYEVAAPPPLLDSLVALANATCIAGGAISITAISGTAPFEFQADSSLWQPTGAFSNLPAGNYLLTVRDAAGCTMTNAYAIKPPATVQDSLLAITAASCIAGGSISVAAVSGLAPFGFQLNSGPWQNTGVFSDLPSGAYTIILLDGAACRDTGTYVVAAPPPVSDSLIARSSATCIAGGALQVAAVSGTGPYEFQLDNGVWQNSGFFPNLPGGNYMVTVLDAAGCTASHFYTIDSSPPVLDSLLGIVHATCVMGGSIQVAASAGTAPFEFQLNGGAWQATGDFMELPAGNYSLTLRDAAGCTHSSTYSIAAPTGVVDSLLAITQATCVDGGSITVAALSGTAPFAFQLDGGIWQADGVFHNLSAGTHSITLRDAAGCMQQRSYTVTAPPPVLDSLLTITGATCISGGSIRVAAISGTAPFEYQLNSGGWQNSGIFSNLPPGNYLLALQDAAGCTHTNTYSVTAPPAVLDSLIAQVNATCTEGGSLHLAALSGTAPFTFQLDNGAGQSSGLFPDLPPGTYSVLLRDAAGCTVTKLFEIGSPPPLHLGLDSLGHLDCRHATGWLNVVASGGTGAYTYQLQPGEQTRQDGHFTGLATGSYTIIVTDSIGCQVKLEHLAIFDLVDTALTREEVTIYEGSFYELPDGRRVGKKGQYVFSYSGVEGCDSVHVIDLIVLPRHVYVPNVFSPNDDGENDFFTVFSDASLALVRNLQVYDRWGELIFEKRDLRPNEPKNGWDGNFRGEMVGSGVFVWFAELEFVDGLHRTIWGDLTVVR